MEDDMNCKMLLYNCVNMCTVLFFSLFPAWSRTDIILLKITFILFVIKKKQSAA